MKHITTVSDYWWKPSYTMPTLQLSDYGDTRNYSNEKGNINNRVNVKILMAQRKSKRAAMTSGGDLSEEDSSSINKYH